LQFDLWIRDSLIWRIQVVIRFEGIPAFFRTFEKSDTDTFRYEPIGLERI